MPTNAVQWLGVISLFASGAVSIALMIRLRVLKGETIVGPVRIPDPTLSGGLLLSAMIGFVTMVAAAGVLAPLLGALPPTTQPSTAPATQAATQPTTQPAPLIPTTAYVSIFATVIAWMVTITLLRMLHPKSLTWLGMQLSDLKQSIRPAVSSILVILPVTFWSMIFFQWMYTALNLHTENVHQLLKLLRAYPHLLPVIVVSACVLAPLFEELIFRGCVQSALGAMLGRSPISARWIAIVISSILFVAVHGELWMMPPLMVLSVGLGYAYERTGKLWVPILTHGAFNLTSIAVMLLSQS